MALRRQPFTPTYGCVGRRLPSARLYVEDLDAIVDVVREAGGDVQILAGDHRADAVSELAEAPRKSLRKLRIEASREVDRRQELFVVDFSGMFVEASKSDADNQCRVWRVYDLVDDRRAKWPILPRSAYWGAGIFLLGIACTVLLAALDEPVWSGLVLSVSGLFWMSGLVIPGELQRILVRPVRRSQHRLGSPLHRVTWIVGAVFFVLGAGAGVVATLLLSP